MSSPHIVVVGAGVSGLSTAVNIQARLPKAQVTIVADRFSPDTTSDVAAGFWYPHALRDTPVPLIKKWGRATWDHLLRLHKGGLNSEVGLQALSGYFIHTNNEPNLGYEEDLFRFTEMTPNEKKLFDGEFKHMYYFSTLAITCIKYLPWLMNRFKSNGGKVVMKKLQTLKELYPSYDIIVNCSGVEAHNLVSDPQVKCVKGQLLKVKAPWIKHFYVCDDGEFYIIPGVDSVSIGGTHQEDDWSIGVDKAAEKHFWEGSVKLVPSLKGAEIIGRKVGHRPCRTNVRLEAENIDLTTRKITIVHNYGHGGSGVTLHWGCAKDAADLVVQNVQQTKSKI